MKRKPLLFLIILSALTGAFFLFSAWSKTTPNTLYFEETIHRQVGFSDGLSAIVARMFIGLEAALGILLLISVYGFRKWVLKFCMGLLIVFSGYLVLLWINMGSNVDCGCMGTVIRMNPWVSLIKNFVLMGIVAFLWRFAPGESNKFNNYLSVLVSLIIIAIPFVIFPMQERTVSLTPLYARNQPEQPKLELRKGHHIVCFMSLTCPHCRAAATLISEINKSHPDIPFYIFFPDEHKPELQKEMLEDFMKQTKATAIPYSFIALQTFIQTIKSVGEDGVPTMLMLNDTTIYKKLEVPDLEDSTTTINKINNWLGK